MSKDALTSEVVVIYDGECDFCRECINWVRKRISITALPFQSGDLASYGVPFEQCSKEVTVICNGRMVAGANAISFLFKLAGTKFLGALIQISGPIGRAGYRWVASHRDGRLVYLATRFLRAINRTN